MHRNIAISAENYKVLVLVIAVVTDGALGVFLDNEPTLVCAERSQSIVKDHVRFLVLVAFLQLLKNVCVIDIVLLLLP